VCVWWSPRHEDDKGLKIALLIFVDVLEVGLWVYLALLFIRVGFSWMNVSRWHQPARLVYTLTDPVLEPLSRLRFLRAGPMDFSPTVAMLGVFIIKDLFLSLLRRLIMGI
jgi:uncharacterized protein YggT (Ycf19 family)